MRLHFAFLLFLVVSIETKKVAFLAEDDEKPEKKGKVQGVMHFINCGRADSILIEQNGRYGLIDASNPYAGAEEVEVVGRAEKNADRSVQAVITYLKKLKVKKLDFILSTHAHADHIGGMPLIAYYFVDEGTKFIYKEYRKNREDNTALFKAAIGAMEEKGATLIDVTDKKYEFDFGEMHFQLINTNIHKKEEKSGENMNSIASIVTYGDKRIFLAADIEIADDLIYKDEIGKVDVFKMSHHGFGDNSWELFTTLRPKYSIIMNTEYPKYIHVPAAFLQQVCKGEVYYSGAVEKASEDAENAAIRLYLSEDTSDDDDEEKKYYLYFENTGGDQEIDKSLDGLQTYQGYTFYFKKGKLVTGLQTLDDESCQSYFAKDGYMVKDACVTVDDEDLCFDEDGCLTE